MLSHALLQCYLACRAIGHNGRDDTREEYHHDDAVEHVVTNEILSRCQLQSHTYQDYRYASSSMGRGESEHEMTMQPRLSQHAARSVCGKSLTQRAHHYDAHHGENDAATGKEQSEVDKHAHAYKEIRYEDGIADELYTVHQRRQRRHVAVENESAEESAEDALEPDKLTQSRTEEHGGENEDELHYGIAVPAQEPPRKMGYHVEQHGTVCHELNHEEQPEQGTAATAERAHEGRHHDERDEQ